MGLRLLAAALLAATAHGACQACMKYLDETWAGRGQHAHTKSSQCLLADPIHPPLAHVFLQFAYYKKVK